MAGQNPVNWFEIPAADLDRAKRFYEAVLEIELTLNEMGHLRMAWFPLKEGATGATGTIMQADSYVPSHEGAMVYFSVESIGETLERVAANGGRVINPKQSIGEWGFVAHFEDSEGNRVGLHSEQ